MARREEKLEDGLQECCVEIQGDVYQAQGPILMKVSSWPSNFVSQTMYLANRLTINDIWAFIAASLRRRRAVKESTYLPPEAPDLCMIFAESAKNNMRLEAKARVQSDDSINIQAQLSSSSNIPRILVMSLQCFPDSRE